MAVNNKAKNFRSARAAGFKPGTAIRDDSGKVIGGTKLPPRRPLPPLPGRQPLNPINGTGRPRDPIGSTPPGQSPGIVPRPRGPGIPPPVNGPLGGGSPPIMGGGSPMMTKPMKLPGGMTPQPMPPGSEAGKADMVNARLGPGSLPGFRGTTPVSGGGASTQLQPRLDIMPWEPDYPGGPLPPPGSSPYYGKPGGGMPAPPQFPGSGGIYDNPNGGHGQWRGVGFGGGMDQSVGSDALGGPSGPPVRGLPPGADIGMGIQESPDQVAPGGGNQAMQDYLSQIQLPKRFQGNIQQAMQFMQQNPQSRLGRGFAAGAPQMGPMNYNPLLGG